MFFSFRSHYFLSFLLLVRESYFSRNRKRKGKYCKCNLKSDLRLILLSLTEVVQEFWPELHHLATFQNSHLFPRTASLIKIPWLGVCVKFSQLFFIKRMQKFRLAWLYNLILADVSIGILQKSYIYWHLKRHNLYFMHQERNTFWKSNLISKVNKYFFKKDVLTEWIKSYQKFFGVPVLRFRVLGALVFRIPVFRVPVLAIDQIHSFS